MMLEELEVATVQGAWSTYDLAERELWEEYSKDPTYLQGRMYIAGEQLVRRRCERAVAGIRFARGPRARR